MDRFQYFNHIYSSLCPSLYSMSCYIVFNWMWWQLEIPHTLKNTNLVTVILTKTPTSHLKALINPAIILFRISYPLSNINLLIYYWIYFLKRHGNVGDFHSVTAAPPVHSHSCPRRRTTWWVNFPNTLERRHYQAQGQHPISCLITMQFL